VYKRQFLVSPELNVYVITKLQCPNPTHEYFCVSSGWLELRQVRSEIAA